jgi:hypothetical protein
MSRQLRQHASGDGSDHFRFADENEAAGAADATAW